MFDKPDVITKASYQISFAYGPDHDYYKRVDNNNGAVTTTYKIGNVEKVIKPDGSYDMKRYLAGVAIWNHHFTSAGTQTSVDKQYLYTDVLGSLVLVTDDVGTVQRQYAYDAWGLSILDILVEAERWLDLHKLFGPISGFETKLDDPRLRFITTLFSTVVTSDPRKRPNPSRD